MKKLISNLLILFILVFVLNSIIIIFSPKDNQQYLAAALDKHLLLSKIPSPRIILVGGSNLAFGVDSEKIEKQLGIQVINLGLHAGIGLRYMVDEIMPFIKKGDIVIIIPEYEFFIANPDGLPNFLDGQPANYLDGRPSELGPMIKMCPQCTAEIRTPTQVSNIVIGILETEEGDLLRGLTHDMTSPGSIYRRDGFNRFGDVITHLDLQIPPSLPKDRVTRFSILMPNPTIKFLNSSYEQMKKQNVQAFFIFPDIPKKDFNSAKKDIQDLYKLLRSELDIPILGTPHDFVFPESFFFDTIYHLNAVGREYRTNRMIELINGALQYDSERK